MPHPALFPTPTITAEITDLLLKEPVEIFNTPQAFWVLRTKVYGAEPIPPEVPAEVVTWANKTTGRQCPIAPKPQNQGPRGRKPRAKTTFRPSKYQVNFIREAYQLPEEKRNEVLNAFCEKFGCSRAQVGGYYATYVTMKKGHVDESAPQANGVLINLADENISTLPANLDPEDTLQIEGEPKQAPIPVLPPAPKVEKPKFDAPATIPAELVRKAIACAEAFPNAQWSGRDNKAYVRAKETSRDLNRLAKLKQPLNMIWVGLAGDAWLDAFTFEESGSHYRRYISFERDANLAARAEKIAEFLRTKHKVTASIVRTDFKNGIDAEHYKATTDEKRLWTTLYYGNVGRIDYDSMTNLCDHHVQTLATMFSSAAILGHHGVFKHGVPLLTSISEIRRNKEAHNINAIIASDDRLIAALNARTAKEPKNKALRIFLKQVFATLYTAHNAALSRGAATYPVDVTLYRDVSKGATHGEQMIHYAIDVVPNNETEAARNQRNFFERLANLPIEHFGLKPNFA